MERGSWRAARRENLFSLFRFTLSFLRSFNFQSNSRSVYIRAVIVKFAMLFFIREMDFITAESFKYKRKETCASMHRNEVNGWSGIVISVFKYHSRYEHALLRTNTRFVISKKVANFRKMYLFFKSSFFTYFWKRRKKKNNK